MILICHSNILKILACPLVIWNVFVSGLVWPLACPCLPLPTNLQRYWGWFPGTSLLRLILTNSSKIITVECVLFSCKILILFLSYKIPILSKITFEKFKIENNCWMYHTQYLLSVRVRQYWQYLRVWNVQNYQFNGYHSCKKILLLQIWINY